MTHEEFFINAIKNLRDTSKSLGIHTVWSGFNNAFRKHFNQDPITVAKQLDDQGIIEIRLVKGGARIYLPGEAPALRENKDAEVLAKILQNPEDKLRKAFNGNDLKSNTK